MKKFYFLMLLLIGLLLRIIVMPLYFNGDVLTQAEWAQSLELRGTKGFYERELGFIERPNHPPLINIWYSTVPKIQGSISLFLTNMGGFIALHRLGASHIPWFYSFVKWYGSDDVHTLEQTSIRYGFMMTVKFLPVIADLLIGWLIYVFAKRINPKKAILYSGIYLLFPFSLYVSAYWGQSDAVSALFMLLSFLLLYKKKFIASPILLSLSLNIKPTGVLVVPLFIYYYFYLRPPVKAVLLGVFTSLLIYFASLYAFTNNNLILYTQKLFQILFFTKKSVLSASAFNFWFIVGGFSKTIDAVTYFFISAKIWGILLTIGLNLIAFKIIRRKNLKSFFGALFIAAFGSWLFLTNMYERYLFNGILALLFLSIVDKKYLKYLFILGSISLLNMMQGPLSSPQIFNFLNSNNMIAAKFLAIINIIVFLRILYSILMSKEEKAFIHLKTGD